MDLQDKINNRDTELQRAYDSYLVERDFVIQKIKTIEQSLRHEKDRLQKINLGITKCHDRAVEQNCVSVLYYSPK